MRTAISVFVGLLAVQQAAACWSDDAKDKLPVCSDACNQCSPQQSKGFDFSTAPVGKISDYQGFKVSGPSDLTCGSFGSSKRDQLFVPRGSTLQKRTGNCVKSSCSKSSGPTFSSGAQTKPFSINTVHLQTDEDTTVQLTYSYGPGPFEGRTCSHTADCKGGEVTPIVNSQCGGATSVQCHLASNAPQEKCSIGVHSIAFDCSTCSSSSVPNLPSSPATSAPGVPSSTPGVHSSVPAISPPESAPGTASPPLSTGGVASFPPASPSAPYPSSPASSPLGPTAPVGTAPAPPASSGPATSESVPNSPITPSAPGSSGSPSIPVIQSTVPIVTSEIVYTTITSCPVTSTHTSNGTTSIEVIPSVSTVLITSTKTICTKCVAPPNTGSPAPPPPASSPNSPVQPSSSPAAPAPPASSPNSPVQPSSSPAAPAPPASSPNSPVQPSSSPAAPAPPASSPNSPVQPSSSPAAPAPPASSPNSPVQPSSSPAAPAPPASSPVQPSSVPAPPASSPNSPVGTSAVPAPPPGTTQEVVTTEVVYTTVTSCPVTNTITSNGTPTAQVTTTVSTVTTTSISTVCTKCVAPPPASSAVLPNSPIQPSQPAGPAPPGPSSVVPSSAPVPVSSAVVPNSPVQPSQPVGSAPAGPSSVAPPSSPVPVSSAAVVVPSAVVPNSPVQPSSSAATAPAPSVLPQCVQTWLKLTKCESSSDADCFCKDSSFTSNVQQCVQSWAQGDSDVQAALSYLAGICAPHVAANPGIITNVPSSISLVPVPAATTSAPVQPTTAGSAPVAPVAPVTSAPAAAAPSTVITVSSTFTLPCSGVMPANQIGDGQVQVQTAAASACTTTTVINTSVTVPQVAFQTGAGSSVGLVAGTPAPAAATPTGTTQNSPIQPIQGAASPSVAASGTGVLPAAKSTVVPFTGMASKSSQSGMFLSVVLAAVGFAVLA